MLLVYALIVRLILVLRMIQNRFKVFVLHIVHRIQYLNTFPTCLLFANLLLFATHPSARRFFFFFFFFFIVNLQLVEHYRSPEKT